MKSMRLDVVSVLRCCLTLKHSATVISGSKAFGRVSARPFSNPVAAGMQVFWRNQLQQLWRFILQRVLLAVFVQSYSPIH